MEIVSNYIADILDDINNEKLQENIKQELKNLQVILLFMKGLCFDFTNGYVAN